MFKTRLPQRHGASVKLRPEKDYQESTWLDRWLRTAYSWLLWPPLSLFSRHDRLAQAIIAESDKLLELSEGEFQIHLREVRLQLIQQGICDALLIPAFGLIREAAGRSLGMRHHHTQIRASLIMLQGRIAEMATGEGKTLAGTLASITAAMAGVKVHVVTTNDYLAERDCEDMQPLFRYLGIEAATVNNESSPEERVQIYQADIVYCSNNELVFDYLKDALLLEGRRDSNDVYRDTIDGENSFCSRLMHRGLVFAIVDEADSVFIDESRTPLVISGGDVPMADTEASLQQMMVMARQLQRDQDYEVDYKFRRIILRTPGKELLETFNKDEQHSGKLHWHQQARREELLVQALTALHLFDRDKHYIVGQENGEDEAQDSSQDDEQDKVMIVDEYTGRLAPDRSWEGGLHQMIEIKEGCEITKPQKTLAKISYQQFFKKYFYLSGMTGTASEVRNELYQVYGLLLQKVPLLRTGRRRQIGYRVFKSLQQKEQQIIAAAQNVAAQGRSVLVGTATVQLSERLAEGMAAAGVSFELLTAKQDGDEAEVVRQAGQAGRITIATSMAGRGTDIKLAADVKAAGGLHVIICELQDASRIDRQLEGRCARQGDPGTVEYILSFQDPLLQTYGQALYKLLLPWLANAWMRDKLGRLLQRYCQLRLENKHHKERGLTQRSDEKERNMLAFLGGGKWR